MQLSPFALLKRSWSVAFSYDTVPMPATDTSLVPERLKMVTANKNCAKTRARPVARALTFGEHEEDGNIQFHQDMDKQESTVSPITTRKKRGKKVKTPLVLPEERRFTRSCLKKDGYRPAPVVIVQKGPKKRARLKLLLSPQGEGTEEVDDHDEVATEEEPVNIPVTPIWIMQKVDAQLGIDPAKLTKDKLEADPADASSTGSDDV
jgi:hypothetical protein